MSPETTSPSSGADDSSQLRPVAASVESSSGFVIVAANGRIVACNGSVRSILGWHGVAPNHPSLPRAVREIVNQTLASGQPPPATVVALSSEQGSRVLNVRTEFLRDFEGSGPAVILELHAIGTGGGTKNLEHLHRLASVGVMCAGVAHDIKNAMVAVRTFVGLLQERSGESELSRLVTDELKRIDLSVRQVLRGATQNEFTAAPLQMHELLRHLATLIHPQTTSRRVKVALHLDAGTDTIEGDEHQLRHAFLNLLMNALESMPDGGEITIGTASALQGAQSHLQIIIADTGCGISAEDLPRLFDPFFTTKQEGTGLGLPITQRIIQEHGGAIEVRSKVGQGTAFEIQLPLR